MRAASEMDFEALFNVAPGAYLILAPDLTIVAVNDAYCRATMMERTALLGRNLFEAFPDNPDDPEATGVANLDASLKRVLADKQPDAMPIQKYDIRRPAEEGGSFEIRYWSPINTPVLAPNGTVRWIIHRVEDVTRLAALTEADENHRILAEEQKVAIAQLRQINQTLAQARQDLFETNTQLVALVQTAADGVILIDRTGSVKLFNPACERMFGYQAAEVIGKNVAMLMPSPFMEEHDTYLARYQETGLRKIIGIGREVQGRRKDGSVFPMDLSVGEASLRAEPLYVGILRDISSRKKGEDDLRVSEERFRTLANKLPGVVCRSIMSAGGTHFRDIYVSDGVRDYLGLDPDAVTGEQRSLFALTHPDDLQRQQETLRGAAQSLQPVMIEIRMLRPSDGQTRWWQVHSTPTALPGGESQLDTIAFDVTERKAAEHQLQHAAKMEAIGQLTGGVAHDFNNLLTVILGNAEALVEELDADHRLRVLAELTQTAAERGAELTNRLLAFARKQALEPKPLDINKLLTGMNLLVRRTLGENIDIEMVGGAGLWNAVVDPGQLETALLNLSINARDAMPNGGKLTFDTSNAHIDETYSTAHDEVSPGQYVLLSVTDTGSGMTPQVAARAFEPFFSTKDVGKGTGLGLSMVYGFVKQSGGHIKIYSEVGLGSTIKMYLPRAYEQASGPSRPKDAAADPRGKEIILLVEDDPLVLSHGEGLVKSLGYTVLTASTGVEALAIIERGEPIDLLFTDVVMRGGIGGRELADRAVRLRPGLKVLFTSGYTENAIVHHGRLDPGVQLLRKPYRRRDLAQKLRQVLG